MKCLVKCLLVILSVISAYSLSAQKFDERKITREYPSNAVREVQITSNSSYVEVDWSADDTVRLTLDIHGKNLSAIDEADILTKLGIKVESHTNVLNIRAKNAIYKDKLAYKKEGNQQYPVFTYYPFIKLSIPKRLALHFNTTASEIYLKSFYQTVSLTLFKTFFKATSIKYLTALQDNSTITADHIAHAKIQLDHGILWGNKIDTLFIESINSTIEYKQINFLCLKSEIDNYRIRSAGVVYGQKNFKEFKIDTLRKRMGISGANMDLRIKTVLPDVDTLKVTNKYGVMNIDLSKVENFTASFAGSRYVNMPSDIIPSPKNGDIKVTPVSTLSNKYSSDAITTFFFSKGNPKARPTYIDVACSSCAVNIK